MKKIFCFLLLITVIFLTACNSYTVATDFECKTINNSFNNYISGGKISYFDNSLICVFNGGIFNIGTYKINGEGVENMLSDSTDIDYVYNAPRFYYYNDKLYSVDFHNEKLLEYNKNEKNFKKSDIDIKPYSDKIYISDNLIVYFSDKDKIKIRYKNYKEYSIDKSIDSFYIYNETLYFINDSGWLYSFDISSKDSKPQFINYLRNGYDGNIFIISDGYVYYDCQGSYTDDIDTAFFKYSLKDDKTELICKDNILSANTYNDKVYFSTDNGIYREEQNEEPKRISNIKADEIYIVDTEWIYLYCNDGEIFRLNNEGLTEKILF